MEYPYIANGFMVKRKEGCAYNVDGGGPLSLHI